VAANDVTFFDVAIRGSTRVGGLLAGLLLMGAIAGCSVVTSLDGLAGGSSDGQTVGDGGASGGHPGTTLPDASAPTGKPDASNGGGGSSSGGGDASSPFDAGAGTSGDDGASAVDSAPDPCAACPTSCGTTINQTMATQPSDWTFNGSASYNSFAPSAELTVAGTTFQAGSAIYTHPLAFDDVVVQFQFRIGLQGGTRSDGMGFMIETTGPNAVGNSGGGLGLAGLAGFAAEFDIFNNNVCGDNSDDHVGVDSLALCSQVNQSPTSLFVADITSTLDLGDTHWHTAAITITAGAMSIVIDGNTFANAVPLPGFSPTTPYYFGFAGATGGLVLSDGTGGYRQEVKNILISFPTTRCL
jgi:hypothetical protein